MGLSEMAGVVRELARRGDRTVMAANSFKCFHSPRVDYLNLLRTPDLTVKLYDVKGGSGLLVNPHTHRYSFRTRVLSGSMRNVTFAEMGFRTEGPFVSPDVYSWGMASGPWTRLRYETPLSGGKSNAEPEGKCVLLANDGPVLGPGMEYFLDDEACHSIVVPEDSVLLLFQYRKVPKDHTILYTRDGNGPDLSGLYQPYPEDDFSKRLDEIVDSLKG